MRFFYVRMIALGRGGAGKGSFFYPCQGSLKRAAPFFSLRVFFLGGLLGVDVRRGGGRGCML